MLCWTLSKKGLFEARSFFFFYKPLLPHDITHFPRRGIWQNKPPSKVAFFAWKAALRKILTMNNLTKRHFIVMGCRMCKKSEQLLIIFCFIAR